MVDRTASASSCWSKCWPAFRFALGVLFLQLGLLVALLRFRLYDAEIVISKSANIALITVGVAAVFAGTADGLKQIIYNYYGNTNSEGPIIFAAALSTVLVNPIQERVQRWSRTKFQKNLFLLRDDLPEVVRDMRETASLGEMLDEVLAPHRTRRALGPERRDRQWPGVQDPRRDRPGGRGMALAQRGLSERPLREIGPHLPASRPAGPEFGR